MIDLAAYGSPAHFALNTAMSRQQQYSDLPGNMQAAATYAHIGTDIATAVAPFAGEFKMPGVNLGLRAGTRTVQEASQTLAPYWPANGGALGKWGSEFLMPGTEIDRFGSGFGKYFSPKNTPMDMRALPGENTGAYNAFKVVKPFEVQSSTIAPAFGKIGLGKQYLSPVNMNTLLKKGIIVPLK